MSPSTPSPLPSPLRRALPALGGLLACAACCAVPLILSAGLGAGVGAWVLTHSALLGLLVLGSALGVVAWRVHARATRGAACAIDGSCGCAARPTADHA